MKCLRNDFDNFIPFVSSRRPFFKSLLLTDVKVHGTEISRTVQPFRMNHSTMGDVPCDSHLWKTATAIKDPHGGDPTLKILAVAFWAVMTVVLCRALASISHVGRTL